MAINFSLDDIRDYERENPREFCAFTPKEAQNLGTGDLVKLIFRFEDDKSDFVQVERMWVNVLGKGSADGELIGFLDNEPYTKGNIKAGDELKFMAHNILEIYHG